MKQVLQDVRSGALSVAAVPAPLVGPNEVLIANQASLLSAGTEKMVMDLARKSLLGKARERPDHVRRVLEKVRNEGLLETVRQVREKLDEPMAMGYSSAGVVLACGDHVQHLKPGDRVASSGPHAEIVAVPKHLVASVPDGVPFDQGAFTVLGAIAMQGVRLANVSLGERVLVIGLGLVGQLTVGLLNAAGCIVLGTDLDPAKCQLARRMGASVAEPGLSADAVAGRTGGAGADAVLITASTKSTGPIELAAGAVRKRGRVVLVGVVGLELDRRPFYFKEAEFVVSCSYGPGRYDADYEQRGHDYPIGYVRWTEQRNLQSVVQLMAAGKLDVRPLISHRFGIDQAEQAYRLIADGNEPYLGILLEYPPVAPGAQPVEAEEQSSGRLERPAGPGSSSAEQLAESNGSATRADHRMISLAPAGGGEIGIGVLGAGNFAKMVLIPKIAADPRSRLVTLCSAKGVSAATVGKKHGFETATTSEDDVFANPAIDVVFSITQHNLHADHLLRAIEAGKHCFVEKPLCLSGPELQEIEAARRTAGERCPHVMVGFNRRFAPAAAIVKEAFAKAGAPLTVSFRFNAGAIDREHWTQHPEEGGGRIIGEACHAIDFATYLTGSPPVRVFAESVARDGSAEVTDDQCFITLRHANGSVSNIAYLAGGDRACPKERVEVFGGGQTAIIEDFRHVTTYQRGEKKTHRLSMDKGHGAEVAAFLDSVEKGAAPPISWADTVAVTLASILAVRSLREGFALEIRG